MQQQDYAENGFKIDEYESIFFTLACSITTSVNVLLNETSDNRFEVSAAFRT